jgi:hypothetical protein
MGVSPPASEAGASTDLRHARGIGALSPAPGSPIRVDEKAIDGETIRLVR